MTARAVRGVDIRVAAGEIHALVGLNGAGKSTLMRLLLGMLKPDRGAMTIGGRNFGQYAERRAGKLSLGNKQRPGLASALQHDPAFIVLDEPTNTLDPAGVILLREALLRRSRTGAGVV